MSGIPQLLRVSFEDVKQQAIASADEAAIAVGPATQSRAGTMSAADKTKLDNGGGGGGAVSSVFGRTGDVTAQSADYASIYDPAGSASTAQTNAQASSLQKSANLSDLANVNTAKTNLSLQNVTNTSDSNKPVSTAQQTAIDLKMSKSSNLSDLGDIPTAKTNLSLDQVDNTSDVNKPVSTAQQTALNLKVDSSIIGTGANQLVQLDGSGNLPAINGGSLTGLNASNLQGGPLPSLDGGALTNVNGKLMVGDTGSGGTAGSAPSPAAGDAAANKFLKADGNWSPSVISGGGSLVNGVLNVGIPGGAWSPVSVMVIYNGTPAGGVIGVFGVSISGPNFIITSYNLDGSINLLDENPVLWMASPN